MTTEPDPACVADPTLDGFTSHHWHESDDPGVLTSTADLGVRDEPYEHLDDGPDHVHPAEQPYQPPVLSPWEIRTIGRRLRLAADSMGVGITRSFAERMTTEGLRRAPEVGVAKTAETVIFFVEPSGAKTPTILGWADRQSFFDRFTTTPAYPPTTAPSPAAPMYVDTGGPEL